MDRRTAYEFGPFELDESRGELSLRGGEAIPLDPQSRKLLLYLFANRDRVVSRLELKRHLWTAEEIERLGEKAHERRLTQAVHQLRTAELGAYSNEPVIETVRGEGFRFVADAEPSGAAAALVERPRTEATPAVAPRVGGRGARWHVAAAATLYASVYAISVFVEVAYRFEEYGRRAFVAAPAVFGWIALTSALGLRVLTLREGRTRFADLGAALGVFVAAALALFVALSTFLPDAPVTEATFQTFTAQGAFLKDILYLLPLAAIYVVVPFHFVVAARRLLRAGGAASLAGFANGSNADVFVPGALYPRVAWLLGLLVALFVVAAILTGHLFEHLKDGPGFALFTRLVLWRVFLYFLVGAEGLFWYAHEVNRLRSEARGVLE